MDDYFYITKEDVKYLARLLDGQEVIDQEDSVVLSPSTVTELFTMEFKAKLAAFIGDDA